MIEKLESMERTARSMIVKVRELAVGISAPSAALDGEDSALGLLGGLIVEPDYSPRALKKIRQHSSSLNQNIQAYTTNIDGQGHRIKSAVDFDSDESWWVVCGAVRSVWRS